MFNFKCNTMKQTAVDFYIMEQTKNELDFIKELITLDEYKTRQRNLKGQANKMFEEQIMDAFNEGFDEGCRYTTGFEQMLWEDDEQYYNETFKSE